MAKKRHLTVLQDHEPVVEEPRSIPFLLLIATASSLVAWIIVATLLGLAGAALARSGPVITAVVNLFGLAYPSYRFAIIAVGLAVGAGLYLVIHRTRVGMLIRAGAANAEMVSALGVNIKGLNSIVFALGAGLAGLAGLMAGPIVSVQSGMGEPILILTLVVIVTGGIGSIRGAFYGALIVGIVDTVGRVFLPALLREFLERSVAQAAGPAIASMLIYLLMAAVLALKPAGLFPVKHG